MSKYFAYGSNCDPAVMAKKGVSFTARTRAVLPGYRLRFNKQALRERLPTSIGFANIEECPDGVVEGILYSLGPDSLSPLDASERYPEHYDRIEVMVDTQNGQQACWVYRAQSDKTADGLVPSRNYLNHILAGREFLSQQYYESLDQSQTHESECAVCHRTNEVVFILEEDQLHTLCQSCREARIVWGDVRGRILTIAETEAVMTKLVINGPGFESIRHLVAEAITQDLIES